MSGVSVGGELLEGYQKGPTLLLSQRLQSCLRDPFGDGDKPIDMLSAFIL